MGLDSELKVGASGSFQIVVDGEVVIGKQMLGFPTETQIVAAVRKHSQG